MTFDEQVAALRGKVEPRTFNGRKADATPEQWAASLDYSARRLQDPQARQAKRSAGRKCSAKRRKRADVREAERMYGAIRRKSAAGREAQARWNNSAKAAAARARFLGAAHGKESRRRTRNSYNRHRLSADPCYRIAYYMRTRLADAIRGRTRSGSAVRDLGCSVDELKARIESQFADGMTWANWGSGPGKWQIDHVYPLAAADLTDRVQLLAVCNYRNLQPMWFEDNMRKGDAVTPEAQALFDMLVAEFSQAQEVA